MGNIYSWRYVADRVERVYNIIWQQEEYTLLGILKRSFSLGPVAGFLNFMMRIIGHLMIFFWEFVCPDKDIEIA